MTWLTRCVHSRCTRLAAHHLPPPPPFLHASQPHPACHSSHHVGIRTASSFATDAHTPAGEASSSSCPHVSDGSSIAQSLSARRAAYDAVIAKNRSLLTSSSSPCWAMSYGDMHRPQQHPLPRNSSRHFRHCVMHVRLLCAAAPFAPVRHCSSTWLPLCLVLPGRCRRSPMCTGTT